jgi:5-methyltetrahydrofolate--homocysteine methyltransferase
MLIIGERLNIFASKKVREALEARNEAMILSVAKEQLDFGAQYLDVHAQNWADVKWLLETAGKSGGPLCLDSPDPEIIRRGLDFPSVRFLNSIGGDRLELFGLARERKVKVVGMLHDVSAQQMVNAARTADFPLEDLYLDPAVMPVSVDAANARRLVENHREIKRLFPGIKTIVGISNSTHGMPRPTEIRAMLLVTLLNDGLDAAILNPAELGWFARAQAILKDDGSGKTTVDYVRTFRKEEAARKAAAVLGPPK